ncbi:hypothetical protein [Flavicella sp.]|uniref:PID-CTERM protein-sorting domain-containing protein n=1 Tax=Flavicella sp. TaxID=2957742 RepID=UPI00301917E1
MFKLNNLKKTTPYILLIGVFFINNIEIFAQGPAPPPPPGLAPPALPIDGGILFIAASALFYGVRKLKK